MHIAEVLPGGERPTARFAREEGRLYPDAAPQTKRVTTERDRTDRRSARHGHVRHDTDDKFAYTRVVRSTMPATRSGDLRLDRSGFGGTRLLGTSSESVARDLIVYAFVFLATTGCQDIKELSKPHISDERLAVEGYFHSDGSRYEATDFSIVNHRRKSFVFSFIVVSCHYEGIDYNARDLGPFLPRGQLTFFADGGLVSKFAHGNTDPLSLPVVDRESPNANVSEITIAPFSSVTLKVFSVRCPMFDDRAPVSVKFVFQDKQRHSVFTTASVKMPSGQDESKLEFR